MRGQILTDIKSRVSIAVEAGEQLRDNDDYVRSSVGLEGFDDFMVIGYLIAI
jgi:hypothetical protein